MAIGMFASAHFVNYGKSMGCQLPCECQGLAFGGVFIFGIADVQMIRALMPLKASSSSAVGPFVTSATDILPSGTSMSLKAFVLCRKPQLNTGRRTVACIHESLQRLWNHSQIYCSYLLCVHKSIPFIERMVEQFFKDNSTSSSCSPGDQYLQANWRKVLASWPDKGRMACICKERVTRYESQIGSSSRHDVQTTYPRS